MHPDTRMVSEHMRQFGLGLLGRAIYDATFNDIQAPWAHAVAVVQAAHGAEIVLKARIAEEHPLLIFEKLPGPQVTDGHLTLAELFQHGRSRDYADLPNLLWATTGYRLKRVEQYLAFGKLRNLITHFAVPNLDLSKEALTFVLQVMEPIVDDFWGETAMTRAEHYDTETIAGGYLSDAIKNIKLDRKVRKKLDAIIAQTK